MHLKRCHLKYPKKTQNQKCIIQKKSRAQRFMERHREGLHTKWFHWLHNHHLIYNTCWEDPRLDRIALNLGPDDTLLTITSAGCNVLDYALLGPKHIYAVDVNYRQNALLELKLAAIQALDFDTFFSMFGQGYLVAYQSVYRSHLRARLSPAAQRFWDRHMVYFSGQGWQRTFYFHGTSGFFARLLHLYVNRIAKIGHAVEALFGATSLEEQRDIYDHYVRGAIRQRGLRWLVNQDMTLSLLGIPHPQRQHIERHYAGGIVTFMEDCVEAVFTRLPCRDNYFWQVYMRGAYTQHCCPEYLKRDNFMQLKAGLAERITLHTCSLTTFLETHEIPISRVILLDHMDWLSTMNVPALQREWQAIVNRAAPETRILWRSGGLQVDYVDPIRVLRRATRYRLGDLLTYHHDLATALHAQDRVHTYGSFYIADLQAA